MVNPYCEAYNYSPKRKVMFPYKWLESQLGPPFIDFLAT